jgi:hypothetical protein
MKLCNTANSVLLPPENPRGHGFLGRGGDFQSLLNRWYNLRRGSEAADGPIFRCWVVGSIDLEASNQSSPAINYYWPIGVGSG